MLVGNSEPPGPSPDCCGNSEARPGQSCELRWTLLPVIVDILYGTSEGRHAARPGRVVLSVNGRKMKATCGAAEESGSNNGVNLVCHSGAPSMWPNASFIKARQQNPAPAPKPRSAELVLRCPLMTPPCRGQSGDVFPGATSSFGAVIFLQVTATRSLWNFPEQPLVASCGVLVRLGRP